MSDVGLVHEILPRVSVYAALKVRLRPGSEQRLGPLWAGSHGQLTIHVGQSLREHRRSYTCLVHQVTLLSSHVASGEYASFDLEAHSVGGQCVWLCTRLEHAVW